MYLMYDEDACEFREEVRETGGGGTVVQDTGEMGGERKALEGR